MQGRETDAWGRDLGENAGIFGKCWDLGAGWVGMGMFGARIWGKIMGFWENAGILGYRVRKLMLGAKIWGKITGFWENLVI